MRRENRRKPVEDDLDTKKMLYITGGVLALTIIVFVITFLVYSDGLSKTTQFGQLDTNSISNVMSEETSLSYGKTVNEMQNETAENVAEKETDDSEKVAINTSSSEEKKTESSSEKTDKTTSKTENEDKKEEKVPDPEFKMPVDGDIMKEFAENKLVYSSTLDVWATHNGIDIEADKTTVVKASAAIKNDPRYGLTVIIEHVNGYKTVYANLLSTEFVSEGEKVKQGQSIGTVGSTATFEISEEPHLHFELLKDNEQQDPELYLN